MSLSEVKQILYKYQIFDCLLNSSIELPELPPFQESDTLDQSLSFTLNSCSFQQTSNIRWFHQWYLADGRVSISCGKLDGLYYLSFPGIAVFEITVSENSITGFPTDGANLFSLRHLLLDQVIPRLLSHQGHLILHASAVRVNDIAILFLGESGQGKSTIAMALQQYGYPLLTDDCVKLQITDNQIVCIPNYIGARLWPDSIKALFLPTRQIAENDGWKNRLYFHDDKRSQCSIFPVKAMFFLAVPKPENTPDLSFCTPVTGTDKFMELNKHCFPLDITNQTYTRRLFDNISRIWKSEGILYSHLHYPRDYTILPTLIATILSACSEPSASESYTP